MSQEHEQERRRSQRRDDAPADEQVEAAAPSTRAEAIKAEMDDLLDEIDAVLEENAEEFVKGYVQKGGQ